MVGGTTRNHTQPNDLQFIAVLAARMAVPNTSEIGKLQTKQRESYMSGILRAMKTCMKRSRGCGYA